jgi:phosphopantetheine adenylyltransferase
MNYTESHFLENKQQQLMKMVSFYDRQIDVLKEMMDEFIIKYYHQTQSNNREDIDNQFLEKKKQIEFLKSSLVRNNYLLTKDINYNQGKLVDTLVNENENLEKEIKEMEKEINELSQKIKLLIINKI